MLKERKRLEAQLKSIDLELSRMPDKHIFCSRNGNSYKWYESDGKKSKYLRKKRRSYAERLAKKKYLSCKKEDLLHELTAIDFYLRHHNSTGEKADALLQNPAYADLLAPYFKPVSQELHEWMNTSYEKCELYPEGLVHKTCAGFNVRSKSEAFIVAALYKRKIPFRYECLLKLEGISYYPDFIIRHPKTGAMYYYEHFGMMDKADYAKDAFAKLQMYAKHGIVLGINLIATFETKEHPLDVEMVESMLDYYFS